MRLITTILCLLPFIAACSGDKADDSGDTAESEEVDSGAAEDSGDSEDSGDAEDSGDEDTGESGDDTGEASE